MVVIDGIEIGSVPLGTEEAEEQIVMTKKSRDFRCRLLESIVMENIQLTKMLEYFCALSAAHFMKFSKYTSCCNRFIYWIGVLEKNKNKSSPFKII